MSLEVNQLLRENLLEKFSQWNFQKKRMIKPNLDEVFSSHEEI